MSDSQDIGVMIRRAVNTLRVSDDHVIELRSLGIPGRYGYSYIAAGWFDDPNALVTAAMKLEARGGAVYVTLNPCKPALLCRANNRVIDRPKSTTGDHDIVRRVWLPFDFDPVRPSGTSASEDELRATRERAIEAVEWLSNRLGEPPSVYGFSGNGYHSLFRLEMPNDEAAKAQIKSIIDQTADRFTDNVVAVDRTVFNASRIWRLYGTLNRKGDSVAKLGRIHRRSAILKAGYR